ncbi:MAG: DegQ family serine endoprotease [Bacteroidales bacterium]
MNLNNFLRNRAQRFGARRIGGAVLVLLLALLVAGWWLQPSAEAEGARAAASLATIDTSPAAKAAPDNPRRDSYADVVSEVAPAVVTIRSERKVRPTAYDDPESLFEQFFGGQRRMTPPQPRLEGALGSGFIVSPDGYILTNNHVVNGAQEITVELPDHRTFNAKVVGTDAPSDLAVLKISASSLHVVRLGDSDQLRVGDVVLAVGDPLGVGETVTMGIVSAKGRATGLSDGSFEDFIQTDAPINQGNSGGPLVNTRGEVVGINSQILSPSGGSIGIGFAIPSRMAENVMQQIVKTGHVRRGMLGVTVQGVTSDMAASLGLKDVRGAIVASVQPDSAAAHAGIKQGDVITAVNGKAVNDSNGLRNEIAATAPGSKVELSVVRDGREQQMAATLEQLPDKSGAGRESAGSSEHGRLGVSVEPLTPELARQLHAKSMKGVVVDEVDPTGPAARAGIKQGDIIKEVNRKPVASVDELQEAVRASGDRPALLLVERDGNTVFVAVAASGQESR